MSADEALPASWRDLEQFAFVSEDMLLVCERFRVIAILPRGEETP